MVDVVIKDADGNSVGQVNGRLNTKSIVETALEHVSAEDGLAFSWSSSFATGGADVECFTLNNDAIGKHLHIDQIWLGASANAVFTWGFVSGGTPAGTSVVGKPMNHDLTQVAEATAFGDAAVTGSVVVDSDAYFQCLANQTYRHDLEGAWILGRDDKFGISCDTSATVYITVIGHFDLVNP